MEVSLLCFLSPEMYTQRMRRLERLQSFRRHRRSAWRNYMLQSIGLVLIAGIAVPPATFANQSRTSPQPRSRDASRVVGTGMIRGRIVDVAGDPVRKARVRARSSVLSGDTSSQTDMEGRYEIGALPAGRYTLAAEKLGYMVAVYGRSQPNELPLQVDVSDGQIVEHVDFKLSRGGVVTGKVVDEFGEPVTEGQVSLVQYSYAQGVRRRTITNSQFTNDLGEFRLFGVRPGRYYLAAMYRTVPWVGQMNRSTYALTYYPAALTTADSQLLKIGADQTVVGLDIMLVPVRPVRVSGVVADSTGSPLPKASVIVTGETVGQIAAAVEPDGSFSIGDLSPGEYIVRATTTNTDEMAATAISVGGVDVSDIRLVPVKPSAVTGRVVIESVTAALKPSEIRVSAYPTAARDVTLAGNSTSSAKVNDDFTFELKTRPGHQVIRPTISNRDWGLKAVRMGGVDVTDDGIDVTASKSVSGVEIVLTNQESELSGIITAENSDATRNAWVIIFAQDKQTWRPFSRHVITSRPDFTHRYKTKLPPGAYYVIAIDSVEAGEWNDADFLERIRPRASTVSIGALERKTLDLVLLPGVAQ